MICTRWIPDTPKAGGTSSAASWGSDFEVPSHGLFWNIPEKIYLTPQRYGRVEDLTWTAWHLLNDPSTSPAGTVEISADDPKGVVAALFLALGRGAVLRAVDHPNTDWTTHLQSVNADSLPARVTWPRTSRKRTRRDRHHGEESAAGPAPLGGTEASRSS